MKILTLVATCLLSLATLPLHAAPQSMPDHPGGETVASKNVRYLSPKKAVLQPGSVQTITADKKTLTIEYRSLHKTGKFPVVRIQGIPFKLTRPGENLEFTWAAAGYDLRWMPKTENVLLTSSEPFNEKSFSLESTAAKHQVIYQGLVIKTPRRDNTVAMMEVTDVQKGADGKMLKFSIKTWSDSKDEANYQLENNILSPEFHKQYEKGVNGEVLYIFTSNEKGEVEVYYR